MNPLLAEALKDPDTDQPRTLHQLAEDVLTGHTPEPTAPPDEDGNPLCPGCDHQVTWPCDNAALALLTLGRTD